MDKSMTEVFALLVYDSWLRAIPELRSSAVRDRHLIFEGNGLILDLLLKAQGAATCIHVGGQILPGNSPLTIVSNVQVQMQQGSDCSSTSTNALGEFAFRAVPNGSFDLVIKLRDHRFVVRGLSNTEPRAWRVVASPAERNT
jgi:hypothetical protein